MGKHFGELAFIRGLIYYKLSHHELKATAGMIPGLVNFIPRARHRMWTWLPTFVTGYLIFATVELAHWHAMRKNPADYASEVDPDPPQICKPLYEPPGPIKKDGPDESTFECVKKKKE